ncbi:MAG: hypothetical protein GTN36_05315 [Candidatus Aenigmarchaeota archaeon]|nr:hypothetical protein [Candidatus Aenigmarchaeota archaeon]
MPITYGKLDGSVFAITKIGNDVYVGGDFSTGTNADNSTTTNLNNLARWDGTTWHQLIQSGDTNAGVQKGGSSVSARVFALETDGTDLYIGGDFDQFGDTVSGMADSFLVQWIVGSSMWVNWGSVQGNSRTINALEWDGTSTLYIGGSFTNIGTSGTANNIAFLSGSSLGVLSTGTNGSVNALVWDGTSILYLGGSFTSPGNNVASWDGSFFTSLSAGSTNGQVNALEWNGSTLYAGGSFTQIDGTTAIGIASWDGSTWNPIGSTVSNLGFVVHALEWISSSSRLYAGTNDTDIGGVSANYIAYCDGGSWNALGSGLGDDSSQPVNCFALFNGINDRLIVGGRFTIAGGDTNKEYIAEWDDMGLSWSTFDQLQCLTEDTRVLTPDGYVTITKLSEGDICITSDGRHSRIKRITMSVHRGSELTYPYIIKKDSIGKNYPPEDFKVSGGHSIKYKDSWILPMKCDLFEQDKSKDIIRYFHIELENYLTDHLVINGGAIVESMGNTMENKERDIAACAERTTTMRIDIPVC